ncbi:MAG: Fic family protein [Clostridiales bacterium]|nr:Fic family protein [Clostridiales bacterium]
MPYLSVNEVSKKWGITDRRVRVLCSEGRIEGATKIGRSWSIPENAVKPIDGREIQNIKYIGLNYDFRKIDELKMKIDSYRPLPINVAKSFHDKLIVEWTYNSNAIEGNTLTLSETKVVLEGITVGGKSIVEHLETINHKEAILFIEDLIGDEEQLTGWNLKNIHTLILKEIDNDNAGRYRSENVLISGAKYVPPKHYELDYLMQKLMKEYQKEWNEYHPVIKATLLHGEFVKIHPFVDGNGRTARLLLNFELMKYGYTPVIIKNERRAEYYDVLDLAHTTMNYGPFIRLVSEFVIESEELWLSILE